MSNSTSNIQSKCLPTLWYSQIFISLGVSVVLFVLSKLIQIIKRRHPHSFSTECKFDRQKLLLVKILDEKNIFGKFINFLRLLGTIASGTIFIYVLYRESKNDAGKPGYYSQIYFCIPWMDDHLLIADFVLQIVFFVHFLISILVVESISTEMGSLNSIIEYFNFIPQILMVIFQRHNYGFRFFNFLRLKYVTNLLLQLNILAEYKYILIAQLICTFFSVWMFAAGLFQLLDAFDENFQAVIPDVKITYFDSLYFLVVTMSTVGYGDILPLNVPSRLFIIVVIVFSISLFASFIPELMANISNQKYKNELVSTRGQKHIVICGYVTHDSVIDFIKDFNSDERKSLNNGIKLVCLSTLYPDTKLETILLRKWTKVQFLLGDATNVDDLKRAHIAEADCAIILANMESETSSSSDRCTVLQATSIKNEASHIRLIIQLLDQKNKVLIKCIPNWNPNRERMPDQVMFVTEFKMNFLANNLVVPGLSTLIMNYLGESQLSTNNIPNENWESKFVLGAKNTIYNVRFSKSFERLTFVKAAKLCYEDFSIILVAVANSDENIQMIINPGDNFHINTNRMSAVVIAPTLKSAKRIENYFNESYTYSLDGTQHNRYCHDIMTTGDDLLEMKIRNETNYKINEDLKDRINTIPKEKLAIEPHWSSTGLFDGDKMDSSYSNLEGEIILLNAGQIESKQFRNHIVICLPENNCCDTINNVNIMLRSLRSLIINQSNDVLLIGNIDYTSPQPLTKLYHLKECPLMSEAVETINLERCHSCIILGQNKCENSNFSNYKDKEAILCSVKIKKYLDQFHKNNQSEIVHVVDDWHLITELYSKTNDEFIYPKKTVNKEISYGFATGATINALLLNSLLSTAYFDYVAYLFLDTLLLPRCSDQNGSRIYLEKLNNPRLNLPDRPIRFNELFLHLLEHQKIVCLGLFRKVDENSNERFVYACPPKTTIILNSDMAYLLNPLKN